MLAFSERAVARDIELVLRSAVANAEANHGLVGDDLVVSAAFADEGPTLKRWRPRARGRVGAIKKRTCHITIVLGESDQPTQRRRRRAAPPAQAEAPAPEATEEKPKRAQRAKKKEGAAA